MTAVAVRCSAWLGVAVELEKDAVLTVTYSVLLVMGAVLVWLLTLPAKTVVQEVRKAQIAAVASLIVGVLSLLWQIGLEWAGDRHRAGILLWQRPVLQRTQEARPLRQKSHSAPEAAQRSPHALREPALQPACSLALRGPRASEAKPDPRTSCGTDRGNLGMLVR